MITQGDDGWFRIRLENADGSNATGVANNAAGLAAHIAKQGAVGAALDLTVAGVWVEDTTGGTGKGYYWVKARSAANYTDTVGKLSLMITYAGVSTDYLEEVRANTEKQVYDRVGAPAGASVSADVAAANAKLDAIDDFIDTEVAAIKTAVDSLVAAVGSGPSMATSISQLLEKVAGLLGLYAVIDQPVFASGTDNLTSCRVRVYDTSANAQAAGATGLLHTFTRTFTYSATALSGTAHRLATGVGTDG